MAAGVLYPTMTESPNWGHETVQPRGMFTGTPEIYFSKRVDNSRVVKIADPKRRREMVSLGITLAMLFLLVMVYLWQHFSAIEYGYKIEQLKSERETIAESTRQLGLEEASLKDVSRIERMARDLGMQPPSEGQWQPMENAPDPSTPVMARANSISVVSGIQ
jgi:cell division protein FtsL